MATTDRLTLDVSAIITDENDEQVVAIVEEPKTNIVAIGGSPKVVIPTSTTDLEINLNVATIHTLILLSDGELSVKLNGDTKDAISFNGFFIVQGGSITSVHLTNGSGTTAVEVRIIAVSTS